MSDERQSSNFASDELRRIFREEERHRRNIRLMWIAGCVLGIAAALTIILHDLRVF